MGLQFYFGAAGAGKSRRLYQDIIEWSLREPERNFILVVPDQFTMHAQMELVQNHPRRGLINIDVLSFGRLAHRIFEETGGNNLKVLDDTGKSLVLRKLAGTLKKELPLIGKGLSKPGYIAEVKSVISEFMQYGIGPGEVEQLAAYAAGRGALAAKLKDLQKLYGTFLAYIKERFITTEETLERLRTVLPQSRLLQNSVVALDGFTGFTPLQYRVIGDLMGLAERVMVSVLLGREVDPFGENKEQELFYLSKKTVNDLTRLAIEAKVGREEDIYIQAAAGSNGAPPGNTAAGSNGTPPGNTAAGSNGTQLGNTAAGSARFSGNDEMAHLEGGLFRYPIRAYAERPANIMMAEAATMAEEVRRVMGTIKELTLAAGFSYREIAVVTGDMEAYAGLLMREADKYGIPLYLDRTRAIVLNPFIEFIRSALLVLVKNYTYETVFHYLRSGFADCEQEEVDRLENYVIARGVKGRKRWEALFTGRDRSAPEAQQVCRLAALNQTRAKIMAGLAPLSGRPATVGEMIHALYEFIVGARIQQKLARYETHFRQAGDYVRAREYGQIYRLVMELLDQIYGLLADETMSLKEFAEILDAGFGEISVGTIPQSVDRVVVGDMERTRLAGIKVLFLLGVNDGNIPRSNQNGGLISDLDREFLRESPWELAPTPRQRMYIQRLYLYMNMTKPSSRLYLSWARVNSEGKGLRPSYLITTVRKLFPQLVTAKWEVQSSGGEIFGLADSVDLFTVMLREFAACRGGMAPDDRTMLRVLTGFYRQEVSWREKIGRLIEAAFYRYEARPLRRQTAALLYDSLNEYSVSRLEKYAACAYAHFLQYGLALREREEYGFEAADLGNVYHGVLEAFAAKLRENNYDWVNFPENEGRRLLREALQVYAAEYGETILFGNARNEQMIERIYRILHRTVMTLQQQLRPGTFMPERFEVSFSQTDRLEAVNIALTGNERLKLRGRIDRIDTCEDDGHVYVKVIDYKSGHQRFDLAALYYGLQLQLVVYMNVAAEIIGRERPEKTAVPAALLYYHVADPMLKEEGDLTPEELNRRLLAELRTTGVVNGREEIVGMLDRDFSGRSLVVPVERKKDGSYSKRAGVLSEEEMTTVSDYVNHIIGRFGREIIAGNIAVNPYESKDGQACQYCAYQDVCGYDSKIPGYRRRRLEEISGERATERMRDEMSGAAATARMRDESGM